MKPENLVHIRVWGDFACFTRPEMKVERVSYPIMTPSAARGVIEAIFWEPQMYYLIAPDSTEARLRDKPPEPFRLDPNRVSQLSAQPLLP
ncbi:MAG: CRISPR-associated protein Cas5 [Verrucomicrobia bacterium]|nr:CRISPR-associated protein Cas5 [Verrucomicrobiota bacterium]